MGGGSGKPVREDPSLRENPPLHPPAHHQRMPITIERDEPIDSPIANLRTVDFYDCVRRK